MSPFYILSLSLIYAQASANIDLIVVGGIHELCSGASVILQCTVSGNTLVWKTPTGDINLVRGDSGSSGVQGPGYHWTFLQLNMTHIQSNLTLVNFVNLLILNCSTLNQEKASITLLNEAPPGAPDRPLTGLDRIKRVNKTFSSVSVVWNIPTTNNAHISSYVVTIDPPIPLPDDGVIAADNPLFNSRQLTLTLQHDQQYNIRVRAKSCNDRVNGVFSSPLFIKVQVPPDITSCSLIPSYDYFSNRLLALKVTWTPTKENKDTITDEIAADVKLYQILIIAEYNPAPEISIQLDVPDPNICNEDTCSYSFNNISEMSALYYSVFVMAKNLLTDGFNERKICSKFLIGVFNDLTLSEIRQTDNCDVQVFCRPLSRFEGTPQCRVTYQLLPLTSTYLAESGCLSLNNQSITNTDYSRSILIMINVYIGRNQIDIQGIIDPFTLPYETGGACYENKPDKNITVIVNNSDNCTMDKSSHQASRNNALWGIVAGGLVTCLPLGYIAGIISTFVCCKKDKKSTPAIPLYEYISTKESGITTGNNQCYNTPKLPDPRKTTQEQN